MKAGLMSAFVRWMIVLIAILPLVSCGGGGGGDSAVANVVDANRFVSENAFTATLGGAQEVQPNASTAIGAGSVIVDPGTRRMTATLVTAGIAGSSAQIQQSTSGVPGATAFTMREAAAGSGVWTAQATLSDAQFGVLQAGGYAFRVSSAAFPAGEIRGPILARLSTPAESGLGGIGTTAAATTAATVFKNALTGTQVVPPVATAAIAIGTAAIDHIAKTLTVAVNSGGIAGIEAHVHGAAPGANGPAVFPLAQTSAGSGIWFAKVSLTDAQFDAIMAGNMYVDIHTAALSAGELRGQILQLQRRARLNDCRFGGFGVDNCAFDNAGLFIGFGLGGAVIDDFGGSGFDGGGGGFDSFDGGSSTPDSGAGASDSPAPGFFF